MKFVEVAGVLLRMAWADGEFDRSYLKFVSVKHLKLQRTRLVTSYDFAGQTAGNDGANWIINSLPKKNVSRLNVFPRCLGCQYRVLVARATGSLLLLGPLRGPVLEMCYKFQVAANKCSLEPVA